MRRVRLAWTILLLVFSLAGGQWTSAAPLPPPVNLTSGLVKAALASGAQATVSLHFFTKEDRWAAIPGLEAEWDGKVAACEGKRDWTRLTVSCQAPENAAKAVLFFLLKGQGQAWFSSAESGESRE